MPTQIHAISQCPNGSCNVIIDGDDNSLTEVQAAFEDSEWPVRVEQPADDQLTIIYDDEHPIMRLRVCRHLRTAGFDVPNTWVEKHSGAGLSVKSNNNQTVLEINKPIDGNYRVFDCPDGICSSGATAANNLPACKTESLNRNNVVGLMVERGCNETDANDNVEWLDEA